MELNREQELTLFRNINGTKKIHSAEGDRISFHNSNKVRYLRENQLKAKSKFIKYFIKTGFNVKSLIGGK